MSELVSCESNRYKSLQVDVKYRVSEVHMYLSSSVLTLPCWSSLGIQLRNLTWSHSI